ncbi:delta-aminolevulinic acid dehydratase [Cyanidioschyzon merolae strain 10D]|jgi:porphobilinogen synthase|uniref:Delta-aminolevulinic acid dehydratase n=2 Tax=Cyanidioschyzon merolae TaxID=45157 RepID=A0A125YG55_CYAM1|eukprot:XP_005535464.1 delta-aminolevulinic acid dehydratase [Cyanidioschyzon merolae strain 10D]
MFVAKVPLSIRGQPSLNAIKPSATAPKRRKLSLFAVAAPRRSSEQASTSANSPLLPRNDKGEPWVVQRSRPRRNRKTNAVREMVRENVVSPGNLVYPVFIHDEDHDEDIDVMPGCKRLSIQSLLKHAAQALDLGIGHIILFPKIEEHLKSNTADECYNPKGLVPSAIKALKEKFGSRITVWTDIALDPYSDQGHDGIVSNDSLGDGGCARILNDETVEQLCRQALCHARAGADIVAPSDMMDGRVGAIRDALDEEGFTDVSIVSYAAKYASSFYGPFRGALDSAPRETSRAPRDKKTYQMDPGNAREALREAAADLEEGADMLLVKPGVPYLDIIHLLYDAFPVPIAAYHVSGEYAMIKAAAQRGWIDEKQVVLETLLSLKRAGATSILTYYALEAAKWMQE